MKMTLLSLAVLCATGSQAQDNYLKWALEEPKSGATVLMGDVSFLLASDWQDTFAIVCKDGTVVAGAEKVNVVKAEPSGINGVTGTGATPQVAISASGTLTLTGCKAGTAVGIYDAAGRKASGCVTDGGRTDIDVSRLTPGIYVLKAGDTAVKFIKK